MRGNIVITRGFVSVTRAVTFLQELFYFCARMRFPYAHFLPSFARVCRRYARGDFLHEVFYFFARIRLTYARYPPIFARDCRRYARDDFFSRDFFLLRAAIASLRAKSFIHTQQKNLLLTT